MTEGHEYDKKCDFSGKFQQTDFDHKNINIELQTLLL
jgi:hypothetical protein